MKKSTFALVSVLFASVAHSATTDIVINQNYTSGYTFYNSVFGQSFTATAPAVVAGFKITDGQTLTTKFNAAPNPYPYVITPVLNAIVELREGEGTSGNLLDTTSVSASNPFEGYLDINYEAKGITLTPGNKYTLLITPAPGENYPYTGSGWILSSGYDTSATAPGKCNLGSGFVSPGNYSGGNPILNGIVVPNDNACPNGVPGDIALHVIDNHPCSGIKEVITGFTQLRGPAPAFTTKTGQYPVRFPDQAHTTLISPAVFAVGELVTYNGSLDASGTFCVAPTITVETASTYLPLSITTTNLPAGTVGVPYSATLSVTGGDGNYSYQYSNPSWITANGNSINGTPTTQGTFSVNVTITDGVGDTLTATLSGNVVQAPVVVPPSCTKPTGAKTNEGKGIVAAVGANYIVVGKTTITYANCTKLAFGGKAIAPKVGDKAEWKGYVSSLNNVAAQSITFN